MSRRPSGGVRCSKRLWPGRVLVSTRVENFRRREHTGSFFPGFARSTHRGRRSSLDICCCKCRFTPSRFLDHRSRETSVSGRARPGFSPLVGVVMKKPWRSSLLPMAEFFKRRDSAQGIFCRKNLSLDCSDFCTGTAVAPPSWSWSTAAMENRSKRGRAARFGSLFQDREDTHCTPIVLTEGLMTN